MAGKKKKDGYRQMHDGEWSNTVKKRKNGSYYFRIRCCDCGLGHLQEFKVKSDRLRFRVWRED